MKQKLILFLLFAFCGQTIHPSFEPLIVQPSLDVKIEGLRKIERFTNFTFIPQKKAIFCYALLEIYIDGTGFQNIIARKEISTPLPVAGAWEVIKAPTTDLIIIGSLGDTLGLVARTDIVSLPVVYTYNHKKKSWDSEYTLPIEQARKPIAQGRNAIRLITGSEDIWWVKTCDLTEKNCSILEVLKNVDYKKTLYTSASVTPDNQYAWLLNQRTSTNLLNIKDLTDSEGFTQEIELPENMPAIEKLVAVDDKNAFFIGSTAKGIDLYSLQLIYKEDIDDEDMSEGIEVKITLIQTPKEPKNFIHANSPLAIYKGQLAVGSGTTIYVYEPQVKETSKRLSAVTKTVTLQAPARKTEHAKARVNILEPKIVELPRVTFAATPDETKITRPAIKKPQPTVQQGTQPAIALPVKLTDEKPTPIQTQPKQTIIQKAAPATWVESVKEIAAKAIQLVALRNKHTQISYATPIITTAESRQVLPQKPETVPTSLSYFQRFTNWFNSLRGKATVTKRADIMQTKVSQETVLSKSQTLSELPPTSRKLISTRQRDVTGK